MTEKILKEAFISIIGKSGEELAKILNTNKHINEFTIANKLDIQINPTRNLLYKLSEKNLVSSIRKKDKKKGWYTYFWKAETIKTLEFFKELIEKREQLIKTQIQNRKENHYYICERCNLEYPESEALLMEFTCPECGGIFAIEDNTKLIKSLERNQLKCQEQLKEINQELENLKEKEVKQNKKVQVKKEKVKKETRKVAREKKAKEKKDKKEEEEKKGRKRSKKLFKKKVKKAIKKNIKKAKPKSLKKIRSKKK
jgi:transcription factor E